MKKFNPGQHRIETASALEVVTDARQQERYAAYVGLDVHKETIAVALAEPGRTEPVYRGVSYRSVSRFAITWKW